MIVGVPRESFPGERRVAIVPAVIPSLTKAGLEVVVEAGAGIERKPHDGRDPIGEQTAAKETFLCLHMWPWRTTGKTLP